MNESDETRTVTPYIDLSRDGGNHYIKDFRLQPVKQDGPDPKDESAMAPAHSSKSKKKGEQRKSATPAPESADKVNGQSSETQEPSTTEPTAVESSSPPSSGEQTSPGWNEPPAPVQPPPTSDTTPTQ